MRVEDIHVKPTHLEAPNVLQDRIACKRYVRITSATSRSFSTTQYTSIFVYGSNIQDRNMSYCTDQRYRTIKRKGELFICIELRFWVSPDVILCTVVHENCSTMNYPINHTIMLASQKDNELVI